MTTTPSPLDMPSHVRPPSAWSMCESKHAYPTFGDAVRVALKRAKFVSHGLRPYRCPRCGDWHLTKRNSDWGER